MRFLFINQYYAPDIAATAQQMADVCERLAREGHEVHVLAGTAPYDESCGPESLAAHEILNGVHVHRVHVPRGRRRRFRDRLMGYLAFYWRAFLRVHVLPEADVVVTLTTPPLISLLGVWLGFWRRSGFVYWVMDIYPDIAWRAGVLSRLGLGRGIWALLARLCYRSADRIVVLGRDMRSVLLRKGTDEDRVVVVPNWADGGEVLPIDRATNPFRAARGWGDDFVVMYSGNLGICHLYTEMITAAQKLVGEPGIRFSFIGGGKLYPNLVEALGGEAPRVEFIGYQPRSELARSLSAADVQLLSLAPQYDGLLVPSKLYGIMAAGRPAILVGSRQSEAALVLLENNAGIIVPPGDGEGLARAIVRLRDDPGLAARLGANARAAFLRQYEKSICTAAFEEVLVSCVSADDRMAGRRRTFLDRAMCLAESWAVSRPLMMVVGILLMVWATSQLLAAWKLDHWRAGVESGRGDEAQLMAGVPADRGALAIAAERSVARFFPPRWDLAEQFLARSLEEAPLDSRTWMNLAKGRLYNGRLEEGRAALAHADSLNPATPGERLDAVQLWILAGGEDRALGIVRSVLELGPDSRLEAAGHLLQAGRRPADVYTILRRPDMGALETARLASRLCTADPALNAGLFDLLDPAILGDPAARDILVGAFMKPTVHAPCLAIWRAARRGGEFDSLPLPSGEAVEFFDAALAHDMDVEPFKLGWIPPGPSLGLNVQWIRESGEADGRIVIRTPANASGAGSLSLYRMVLPAGTPPLRVGFDVLVDPPGSHACRIVAFLGEEGYRGEAYDAGRGGLQEIRASLPAVGSDAVLLFVLEYSRARSTTLPDGRIVIESLGVELAGPGGVD